MNKNSFLHSYLYVFFLTAICLISLSGCQAASDNLINESKQDDSLVNEDIQSKTDSSKEEKGKTFTAKIVRVVDGDTVKIKMTNGNEETVRLLLVDTPETVHPSKPVQPFGPEASKFTKDLMPAGSKVEVETGIGERDKYGRLLAYFYVDGKMVNKLLLEKGLARVAYVYAPNTKYLDEFEDIQKQAQKDEIGIWSIENYATSRGFDDSKPGEKSEEKTTVNSSCSNPKIKGNINSKGNKIYHIPSGQYYEITKPEEMFCTEHDAQDAGFRKSQS
ncbi:MULTISPECIES: thermonuclease family protein [unclassified Peribacillus]|uniref:thermonuclease family protein n=1 Tax=unclassified Peribacillus TaxID=2675266 RepID=UPI00366AC8FD